MIFPFLYLYLEPSVPFRPKAVTSRTSSFKKIGVIEGSLDSFVFDSSNSHFAYGCKEGKIESLSFDKKKLKSKQLEIIEAYENKIKELVGGSAGGSLRTPKA